MNLKIRQDYYKKDISYINTQEIIKTCRLVEELSQIKIAYNKALVGRNAFLHESGIHQDGLLKSPQTYQLIDPKDIGLEGYQLIIGKLSGKHALESKLAELGCRLGKEEMDSFSRFFKDSSAKKKFITDDDVLNLLERFKNDKVA